MRCGWITLSYEEAVEQGILEEMPDLSEYIDDDFNHAPGYDYSPDPDDYDDDLSASVAKFVN